MQNFHFPHFSNRIFGKENTMENKKGFSGKKNLCKKKIDIPILTIRSCIICSSFPNFFYFALVLLFQIFGKQGI